MPRSTQPASAAQRPDAREAALVAALRAGDEEAFIELVRRHQTAMLRVALAYVPSRSVAEEVVQETWLAVVSGVDRFEGRSSVKTWLFRILVNRARTRGAREARSVPFSALGRDAGDGEEPAVDSSRFVDRADRWGGHWAAPPRDWSALPEHRLASREAIERLRDAIRALPQRQREVIVLRDIEGCTSAECCDVLGVSEGNQRVLLHRARSKVRRALEDYIDGMDAS